MDVKVVIEKTLSQFHSELYKIYRKTEVMQSSTSSQTRAEPKLISTLGPFLLTLLIKENKTSDQKAVIVSHCVTKIT